MKFDDNIWAQVKGHVWKWEDDRIDVVGAIVHATRSGIAGRTAEQEYSSTKNWFTSPNNFIANAGNAYGGMSNLVIGGGRRMLAVPFEYVPRFSAGIHDYRAISIEVGQANRGDSYDPRDIELLGETLEELSATYHFPVRHIAFVDGTNRGWPGVVGHEDTAQGRGQGKSDPGPLLWQQLAEWEASMAGLSEEQVRKIAREEAGKEFEKQVSASGASNLGEFLKYMTARVFAIHRGTKGFDGALGRIHEATNPDATLEQIDTIGR